MLPIATLLIEKGLPLLADTIMVITKNSGINMATDYLKRKLGTDVDMNTTDPEKLKKIGELIDKHKDRLDILEDDLCDMDELIGLHRDQCMSIDDDLQELKQRVDEHDDTHKELESKVNEPKTVHVHHDSLYDSNDVFIRRFVPVFSLILFVVSMIVIAGVIWIPSPNDNMVGLESSVVEFAKNIIIMIISYYLGSSQSSQDKMDTIRKMKTTDTR